MDGMDEEAFPSVRCPIPNQPSTQELGQGPLRLKLDAFRLQPFSYTWTLEGIQPKDHLPKTESRDGELPWEEGRLWSTRKQLAEEQNCCLPIVVNQKRHDLHPMSTMP